MKKILVPLDGSKFSKKALESAIELAKAKKSQIICLHVLQTDVSTVPLLELLRPLSTLQPIDLKSKLKKQADKILNSALEKCKQKRVSAISQILEGNPGFQIVKFAQNKKNQISMIVIGSRGKGHSEEILLGSVSYYVVHKSKIPVTIVR